MRPFYRNYMLALLALILAFSYVDRMVFSTVLQDIKIDLQLSDTQLGFLNGLGYALFFAVMGIPIARWADRGNRVLIIALTTGLWSVAVSLCAMAGSFMQLFLMRIGIAVGEAGCSPPANSLIPDYFARAERARSMARYMIGIPVGVVIGYLAGGWLNELYGWRTTFMIVGAPGVVLATVAMLTLREPRRRRGVQLAKPAAAPDDVGTSMMEPAAHGASAHSFKDVSVLLWSSATFRHLMLAYLVWYFCGWGLVKWMPTFFVRSHGLQSGELGTWMALTQTGGILSAWFAGELAVRYAANNERLQLVGVAAAFVAVATLNLLALSASSHYWAFGLLAVAYTIDFMSNGPIRAVTQTLVPPRMRATALALVTLLPSFVGTGLGALAVGVVSDALHAWAAKESLRYAMLLFCPGYAWAAWHFWRASRTVVGEIAAREAAQKGSRVEAGVLV